jgi:hypothetical protein
VKGLVHTMKITSIGPFLAELAVYTLFVLAYFFLVLHFLCDRLKHVFDDNKNYYAILSLALIAVQGVFLEMLTSALLRVFHRKAR